MLNYRKQSGFNVVELMVVLFIGGILLTVAVPAFTSFVDNNRMAAAANELASTLHLARTEALKRRANITVCPSANWDADLPQCTAGNFTDGWIVFMDAVAPAPPDLAHTGMADILLVRPGLPEGVELANADSANPLANDPFLVFGPNGFPLVTLAGNNATFNFQLCDHRGDADAGGGRAAGRWIQVSPTGRPQIYRNQVQVQSGDNPAGGC